MMSVLMPLYHVVTFSTPADALRSIEEQEEPVPSVIVAEEMPPPKDGVDVILETRDAKALWTVPFLFVSARPEPKFVEAASKSGADLFLVKPYRKSALINYVSALANKKIEDRWASLPDYPRAALKKSIEVFRNFNIVLEGKHPLDFLGVMNACGPILDAVAAGQIRALLGGVSGHDNYPFAHAFRVAALLGQFGQMMGLPRDRQIVMASAGLLFDVGKLAIPPDILNKQGSLTAGEMQLMRSHVESSVRVLSAVEDIPRGIITIAEQHHERLDGSGYPKGLRAGEINDLARMGAVVDVFCGLTDQRVYKVPLPPNRALAVMEEEMRTQLDQQMLTLFRTRILASVFEADSAPRESSHSVSA
jgi:HD-GYP domain-containing protein (c-di-GMP phosphodiesterase class II)